MNLKELSTIYQLSTVYCTQINAGGDLLSNVQRIIRLILKQDQPVRQSSSQALGSFIKTGLQAFPHN